MQTGDILARSVLGREASNQIFIKEGFVSVEEDFCDTGFVEEMVYFKIKAIKVKAKLSLIFLKKMSENVL